MIPAWRPTDPRPVDEVERENRELYDLNERLIGQIQSLLRDKRDKTFLMLKYHRMRDEVRRLNKKVEEKK